MIEPFVSVLMPAYNMEKYIDEAITSVLNQSYKNFEFIIINDGSTDRTEEIILSYSDPRIKYIKNEENLKLIDTLNKGLNVAKGKYIARMDADDICLAERLEKQVNFMESNPEIGLSGAQLKTFGTIEGIMTYPLTHEDIKLKLFITSSFGNNVVIFRKDIMEKYKLFFPKGYYPAEDYKCWTNWTKHTQVINLNEYLVKYRSHPDSISASIRELQRQKRKVVRAEYLIETFELENNSQVATDFVGDLSSKRIRAVKYILKRNRELNLFPVEKMERIILDLWYSDSLEQIEKNFMIIFKFPYILKIGFKNNLKRWWYLLKHFIKINYSK